MAAAISLEVTGQATVDAAYRAIVDGATDMPMTWSDVGAIAQDATRAAAPRRSGWLASTISSRAAPDRVTLTGGAIYAGVIDWGWAARGIRPSHFTLRGIRAAQANIVAKIGAGLELIVADAQGGGQ